MDSMKNAIRYKKFWVLIDEIIDACDRSVPHFIIGILPKDKDECKQFLVNTSHLQATNSTTIAKFFEDTVNIIYPHVIDRNDILLIITDAALYMGKAVKSLNLLPC